MKKENNIALHGSHNGGIAFHDGENYRVIEIERFINKKNYGLTQYLLCNNNKFILQEMLKYIYQNFNISPFFDNVIYSNTDAIYDNEHRHYEEYISSKNKINCLHHHSHAAGTFYQSPFEEAIVISYDGGGSDGFFNVFLADRTNGVKNIKTIPIDFGFSYMSFGHFLKPIKFEAELGMGNLVYSGKLMGLCGYGQSNTSWLPFFKEYYYSIPNGNNYQALLNKLGEQIGVVFDIDARIDGQLASDIAATSQTAFEDIFIELITPFINKYNLPVCISGGCALNVLCNSKVKNTFDRDIFIAPNSSDCGIALGMLLDYEKPQYQVDATYAGLPVLDPYVLYELIENKYAQKYTSYKAADIINSGFIIGVMQGNCEHGPRALGNRSILCNPSIPNIKDTLNEKVKQREWFRPFAPIVKLENVNKYFEFDDESRFMSYCAKVREEYREQLKAITHIDGTARLQTITKNQNEYIYNILTDFEKISGLGVLLNTSFNINGRPLINTYKDAMMMLDHNNLDYLFTDQFIIHKQ